VVALAIVDRHVYPEHRFGAEMHWIAAESARLLADAGPSADRISVK
jgi:hypothetical protein